MDEEIVKLGIGVFLLSGISFSLIFYRLFFWKK